MASFEPLTFAASIGGSLVVSYIGVRYFTGEKIRAERADLARRELRKTVAPWLRSAQERASGRGRSLQREAQTSDAEDGVSALAVLRLAEDLPRWRRALVRRRCRIIFGSEWSALADEQIHISTDPKTDADRLVTRALFQYVDDGVHILGSGKPRVTFSSGLIQRVYSSNVNAEAHLLVRQLRKLSRAR
ncbi:hypothetical protein [Microbacterium sp. 179-I 3D4 NHS]|uniref:hypothetical protein n=1 Tax=Microbacterium sp. 179-I 3D4 NHS TaxID=3142381 RepID=UPI0039A0C549